MIRWGHRVSAVFTRPPLKESRGQMMSAFRLRKEKLYGIIKTYARDHTVGTRVSRSTRNPSIGLKLKLFDIEKFRTLIF